MLTACRLLGLVAGALLIAAPAAAQRRDDCSNAGRGGRPCNPQQECLAQAERKLKGSALDAARRDCSRMPTSGTCYDGGMPTDCAPPPSERRR